MKIKQSIVFYVVNRKSRMKPLTPAPFCKMCPGTKCPSTKCPTPELQVSSICWLPVVRGLQKIDQLHVVASFHTQIDMSWFVYYISLRPH